MDQPLPRRISDEPLRVAAAAHRRAVVIQLPGGFQFWLTPEAAERSLKLLADAARCAGEVAAPDVVSMIGRFRPFHPFARLTQHYRQAWKRPLGLRGVVATVLMPVVFGVILGIATLVLLSGDGAEQKAAWLPWLPVLAALIAAPLAWLFAPRLMSSEECRPELPSDARLHLVSTT